MSGFSNSCLLGVSQELRLIFLFTKIVETCALRFKDTTMMTNLSINHISPFIIWLTDNLGDLNTILIVELSE